MVSINQGVAETNNGCPQPHCPEPRPPRILAQWKHHLADSIDEQENDRDHLL